MESKQSKLNSKRFRERESSDGSKQELPFTLKVYFEEGLLLKGETFFSFDDHNSHQVPPANVEEDFQNDVEDHVELIFHIIMPRPPCLFFLHQIPASMPNFQNEFKKSVYSSCGKKNSD